MILTFANINQLSFSKQFVAKVLFAQTRTISRIPQKLTVVLKKTRSVNNTAYIMNVYMHNNWKTLFRGIPTICEWNMSTKMLLLINAKRQFQLSIGFEWESSTWNWNVLVSTTWRMYVIRIFNCNHQIKSLKTYKKCCLEFCISCIRREMLRKKEMESEYPYHVKKQKSFAITFVT